MGTISNVPTPGAYDSDTYADGSTVKADIEAIVAEFNGSVDTINIANAAVTSAKLAANSVTTAKIGANAVRDAHMNYSQDDSGALVWRNGPTHVGSSGGRIARVKKPGVDFSAGDPLNVTFTFATDCEDGNPAFTAAPTLLGSPVVTASDNATAADVILGSRVTTLDNTQAIISIDHNGSAATVTIEFGVAGEV